MANLKSSKKDIRRTLKRTEANKPFKRNAKVLAKKVEKLVKSGNNSEAGNALSAAYKAIDKAAKKKVLNKKAAARRKSRLAKLLSNSSK